MAEFHYSSARTGPPTETLRPDRPDTRPARQRPGWEPVDREVGGAGEAAGAGLEARRDPRAFGGW